MKKIFKKILCAAAICALLFSFSFAAFAKDSGGAENESAITQEEPCALETAGGTSSDENLTENPSYLTENEEKGDVLGDTGADESLFQVMYDFTLENIDKFLSALAFIASLVLAFAYKKGLIPLVKAALSSLGGSVGKFEKQASCAIEKTEETVKFLSERFAFCENTVEELSNSIELICERIREADEERAAIQSLKEAMLTEVEMLYDVFMHSSLPQYSKDNVGEKISEMKKRLAGGGEK
ncbi:MAG: hypothetical protein J6Q68_03555 [Clostridia bacterium]|nr:hypothetical protein [Clostridia bacterium]